MYLSLSLFLSPPLSHIYIYIPTHTCAHIPNIKRVKLALYNNQQLGGGRYVLHGVHCILINIVFLYIPRVSCVFPSAKLKTIINIRTWSKYPRDFVILTFCVFLNRRRFPHTHSCSSKQSSFKGNIIPFFLNLKVKNLIQNF